MKRLFFDMDGVLAEYRENCTEKDMKKRGYFSSLRPEANMVSALKMLLDNEDALGISVCVITKVYPALFRYSVREKLEWRDEYLDTLFDSEFIMVNGDEQEKSDAVREQLGFDIDEDCILIDDYNPNLREWNRNGGTTVKYVNAINDKNKSFIGRRISHSMSAEEIYGYILDMIGKTAPSNAAA